MTLPLYLAYMTLPLYLTYTYSLYDLTLVSYPCI